jgi:hypothetical protein
LFGGLGVGFWVWGILGKKGLAWLVVEFYVWPPPPLIVVANPGATMVRLGSW